jgi:cytochrome c-type biogenesis protein CcmE
MPHKAWTLLLREKIKAANPRLLIAMFCYLVLILVAVFMLQGFLRNIVLFFFAILIVKTIVHSRDEMPE